MDAERHSASKNLHISCVIPAYNEASNIERLLEALDGHIRGACSSYDVIVVDDGSRDQTSTIAILASARFPVRLIQLSRNFGKEIALAAGIDHAEGDVVVLLDADSQHPPSLIPQMLDRWREGYDMVYAMRVDRHGESPTRQLGSRLFYRLIGHAARIRIPENAGDFRLLDRRVVRALRLLPERSRFMKGLYAWVGFRSVGIPFSPEVRTTGGSRFGLRSLAALALTGITSFSELPLRMWSLIGAAVSVIAVVYSAWIVVETMFYGNDVPGWATLAAGVMFLGGVQLLSVGILGEYIGRIFNEVKQRPLYLVSRRHGFPPDLTTLTGSEGGVGSPDKSDMGSASQRSIDRGSPTDNPGGEQQHA